MHLQPIVKMTVKFLAGFEANVERFFFLCFRLPFQMFNFVLFKLSAQSQSFQFRERIVEYCGNFYRRE